MKRESILHIKNYREFSLGSKAKNLFILAEEGFPVPEFFCIRKSAGEEETGQYLRAHFPSDACFAVRSAARVEDGEQYSFAGQFSTRLSVPLPECWMQARQILAETTDAEVYVGTVVQENRSGDISPELDSKCKRRERPDFELDVIIQKMVDADISGVLFTANPQGLLNEMVIAAAPGVGTGVVEERLPSASFYFNRTDRIFYCEGRDNAPQMEDELLMKLIGYGERIEALFGAYQDIEFAVKDRQIFILQARPITSFPAAYRAIVLDNSNIVESYPGISLPATQSFARRVYSQVFRSCLLRLCRDQRAVQERDSMLQNMIGVCSGRIYYQISSWYEVLLLLPFSSKIIPIWQEMLGVREKEVEKAALRKPGLRLKGRVALSFFRLLFTCPKRMEELNRYFDELIRRTDLDDCRDGAELLDDYYRLEGLLSSRWDITLVNDMYTFLYTALLKRTEGEARANEILSGITGLESMKPLRELMEIAAWVRDSLGEPACRKLCGLKDNAETAVFLKEVPELSKRVTRYISLYGDRYMEELKLESRTYRTDPVLLLRQIGEYAKQMTERAVKTCSATDMRRKTRIPHTADIPHKPAIRTEKKGGFPARIAAGKAAVGIRNRELSRMNRSRIFGLVREIFLRIGKELSEKEQLEEPGDVFYLFFEELEEAVRKETDYRGTIRQRKSEYESYGKLPAYSRLVFCGEIFDRKPAASPSAFQQEKAPSVLYGTPSSAGTAEGEVLVVRDPSGASGVQGKILVAPMTDPGWVFLIAQAKALVVEKGSLLSHTAIVTREMRKPSVIGATRAADYLENGDWVRVNGSTGEIVILKRKSGEERHEEHR